MDQAHRGNFLNQDQSNKRGYMNHVLPAPIWPIDISLSGRSLDSLSFRDLRYEKLGQITLIMNGPMVLRIIGRAGVQWGISIKCDQILMIFDDVSPKGNIETTYIKLNLDKID